MRRHSKCPKIFFSNLCVKIGRKRACFFTPLFHTYRKKNSNVHFNPHTPTASPLSKSRFSAASSTLQIKHQGRTRDKVITCRRTFYEVFILQHLGWAAQCQVTTDNVQAPSESSLGWQAVGETRITLEEHLCTIQKKAIRR